QPATSVACGAHDDVQLQIFLNLRPQNTRHTGIDNLSTQKRFVAKRPLTRICLKCFSIQLCHSKLRNRSPHSFTTTVYRIILSASASTLGGNVRPICFAAFKLMMNSNLVGLSMCI